MESIKKHWLWSIFISILSIFAMSHNAGAISFSLNNYEPVVSMPAPTLDCTYNGVDQTNVSFCTPTDKSVVLLTKIAKRQDFALKKGDIIRFSIVAYTKQNYTLESPLVIRSFNTIPSNLEFIDLDIQDGSTISLDTLTTVNNQEQLENFDIYSGLKVWKMYTYVYRVPADTVALAVNGGIGLYVPTGGQPVIQYFDRYQSNGIYGIMQFNIMNFQILRFQGTDVNKEQEEKTQEAVDDSQTAGSSSSQDAATGTTGLLSAITGAVSVITAASPTNCKINGNMGNLDMGQLDLCANPAPAFIQTIGSLILILMCVPLAISLFNRFIAIFRSFQS